MRLQRGMIVKSDAGHDQERYYAVVASEENGIALIADGKRRRLEKPKRKNVRHLKKTNQTVNLSEVNTNPKLQRALRDLNRESPSDQGKPCGEEEMRG